LCVVLDDAHFADAAALDALEYAALAEAQAPIWICAFARPTFERTRRSWGERAGRHESLRLDRLGTEEAMALGRPLLLPAENVSDQALSLLVERTQGIPLLLVELVRGLKRDHVVRQHAKSETWFLATEELDRLPSLPLVEWMAQRELHALSPD